MTVERQSQAAAPDEESLFGCLWLPVNSQSLILERDLKSEYQAKAGVELAACRLQVGCSGFVRKSG
jgi:hypothetical protein